MSGSRSSVSGARSSVSGARSSGWETSAWWRGSLSCGVPRSRIRRPGRPKDRLHDCQCGCSRVSRHDCQCRC
ncbi:hypothetical protein EZE58_08020 [Brevibacterium sp. LS14]|nr:hypothetical protein [Brevibacterium sp. LS14]